ncbi:formate-dependent phosphoribosylglycinamide formyltransferase [Glaciecola siphonariae]|uniref:Formate-dependent phosphoribosylglycinamide formyltransferase n=1 Tax=Glaciecola siphonariae TaxID=521012 RepID=A0ABV9LXN5_9ALTE
MTPLETVTLGTPFSDTAVKVMLCGGGELGKEMVIELKRLGCEVIVLDRYENTPAMQVADRSHCVSMLDEQALREITLKEKPDYIVPEIEAIATSALIVLEQRGFKVVPSAKAAHLTMNREGIRRLVAEELGLPTSDFVFAEQWEDFEQAASHLGFPCIVKPIMSSSGKGQSLLKSEDDLEKAWQHAQEGGRSGKGKVIIESLIDFEYEITLLTIRHKDGTSFCEPIGHRQEDGDYRESWQPQKMSEAALKEAKEIATKVTEALGGYGLFGVELFVKGDEVWFSEVSPRPHDTGMVTLISQHLSEFALHARAFLGLPIPNITFYGPSASTALLVEGESSQPSFSNLAQALQEPNTDIKLFGKPEVKGRRRMGVTLARADSVDDAVALSKKVAQAIKVSL